MEEQHLLALSGSCSVSLHSPESDAAYSGLDPRTTKIIKTWTCPKTNLIETTPLSIQSFSADSTLLTINANWIVR